MDEYTATAIARATMVIDVHCRYTQRRASTASKNGGHLV